MYNRYIPQPDGSYRRRPVPQTPPPRPQPPEVPPCPPPVPSESRPTAPVCDPPTLTPPPSVPPCPPRPRPERPPAQPLGGFLRNLLPKDFGTEDLLVVLLLLLMAGENLEDQNTALLTLALYLFL